VSRRLGTLLAVLLALAGAAAALGACGGNDDGGGSSTSSTQEQANAQVCAARDDIGQQVDRLSGLEVTTANVDEVRTSLTAIGDDLRTIAVQAPQLSAARRQQVDEAARTFADEVVGIVGDIGRSLSVSGAGRQVDAALTELRAAYSSSLAQLDCG
jgi:hypothetical protein